jgi:hypothetical protein
MNSKLPEMVQMPDLIGKSRRIALPLLEIAGLKLDNMVYKPDESCTDCIIGHQHNGKPIEPGDKLRKGDKITLVLGRQSNKRTTVPNLLGLTFRNAAEIVNAESLNMGQIIECKDCPTAEDTLNAYVVNQLPKGGNETTLGSFVDVFLSTDTTGTQLSETPENN